MTMLDFALLLGGFLFLLAALAAVADWMGEPERWEARRRNGRR